MTDGHGHGHGHGHVRTQEHPLDSAITLDSVDVDAKLLKGFQVMSVEPSPKDSMHVPVLNQRTWSFGMSVPARSVQRLDFKLRPVSVGRFSGNVDACNPGQDCAGAFADVVVGSKKR